MMHTTPATLTTLGILIDACEDDGESLQLAADSMEDLASQAVIRGHARQRAAFANELRALVPQAFAAPRGPLGLVDALPRAWDQFRLAAAAHSDCAVLGECRRTESEALAEYRRASTRRLPLPVAAVVRRHMETLQAAQQQLVQLLDEARHKARPEATAPEFQI